MTMKREHDASLEQVVLDGHEADMTSMVFDDDTVPMPPDRSVDAPTSRDGSQLADLMADTPPADIVDVDLGEPLLEEDML